MSAETAIETELSRQYAMHQEWDEAKEVIEGLDCVALAQVATASLRAQNAKLVAALEKARDELESWYDAKNVLATINAALAAAGHKQGGGDTIITKGVYRGDKRLLDDMYGGTDD
jgi:hypothetical protein